MKKKYLYLIFLILFPILSFSNNKEFYINNPHDIASIDIEKYLYIYEDVNHNQKIDSLIKHDELFKIDTLRNLNWGFTSSAIWLRFSIINKFDKEIDLILSIDNPDINEIDFYRVKDSHILNYVETGEARNFTNREINHRNFLFHITIKPGEKKTYYIRSYNNGDANFFPLSVSNYETFIKNDNQELMFDCIAFGICLFIIIFNIYLFFTIGGIYYLYYSLYVFSYCIFLLNIFGISPQLFWTSSPWWAVHSTLIFISFCPLFFILFVEKFLNTESIRFINYILLPFKIISILFIILCFFNYPIFLIPTNGLGISTPLVVLIGIIISIIKMRKKYFPAYYAFFAFTITIIGVIVYLFEDIGLIDNNFYTLNAMMIGIVIEMLILSFAIVDRFRREQNETHAQLKNQKEEIDVKNKELEKLSIVASKTDNIVIIFDKNGNFEWANASLKNVFGVTLSTMKRRAKGNGNIFHFIDKDKIEKHLMDCYETYQTVIFELELSNKNNKKIWLQTTLTPILNASGEIEKFISISTDISKLKLTEEELTKAKERAEESDRLKSSFLANMSHEIRTPISIISGLSDILIEEGTTEEQKKEYLSYIKNNINKLVRLIDDIIEISKIEAKKINMDISECHINKLLTELYFSFNQTKNRRGKEDVKLFLKQPNPEEELVMLTDNIRFLQIINNLLDNALKFTEEGYIEFGYILPETNKIEQGKTHPKIKFYVKDTGIGIEKDKQKIIFDRFRRIENAKKAIQGTGLGLAISKNLVEMLGGEIWVESTPGVGSTFYFTIPFIEVSGIFAHSSTVIDQNVQFNWKHKTILIAEDEELYFKVLEILLKKTGTQILWAKTGIEALNITRANDQINLILMDINMPEMNGYDAIREIRRFKKEVPIIAHTAFAMDYEKEECLKAGCDEYVTKPVDYKKLLIILSKYLTN